MESTDFQKNLIKVNLGQQYMTDHLTFTDDRDKRASNLFLVITHLLSQNKLNSSNASLWSNFFSSLIAEKLNPVTAALSQLVTSHIEKPLRSIKVDVFTDITTILHAIFHERIAIRIDHQMSQMHTGILKVLSDAPEELLLENKGGYISCQLDPSYCSLNPKITALLLNLFHKTFCKRSEHIDLSALPYIRSLECSKNPDLNHTYLILRCLIVQIDQYLRFKKLAKYHSLAITALGFYASHYEKVIARCQYGIKLLNLLPTTKNLTLECEELTLNQGAITPIIESERVDIHNAYRDQIKENNDLYRKCYNILKGRDCPIQHPLEIKIESLDVSEFPSNHLPMPDVFDKITLSPPARADWTPYLHSEIQESLDPSIKSQPTKKMRKWLKEIENSLLELKIETTREKAISFQSIVKTLTPIAPFAYHPRTSNWFTQPEESLRIEKYRHITDLKVQKRIIFEHQFPLALDILVGTVFSQYTLPGASNKASYILVGFCNKTRFIMEYGLANTDKGWMCVHRWMNLHKEAIERDFNQILFNSKAYSLEFPALGETPLQPKDLSTISPEDPEDYPAEYLENFGLLRVQVEDHLFEFLKLSS